MDGRAISCSSCASLDTADLMTVVLAYSLLWNVTGMMSNSHFRVKLQLKADSANQVALHCEHPTKNGAESGGWMERESLSLQVCSVEGICSIHQQLRQVHGWQCS